MADTYTTTAGDTWDALALRLLVRLAQGLEVHIYALHPSPACWDLS